MKHSLWTLLSAVTLVVACGPATPEQGLIDDAAEALGGRDRVLAVQTLLLEGGGSNGNLGQDMTPEETGQTFAVSDYRRAIDLSAGSVRVSQTRTPNFNFFQGPQPQTQTFGLDREYGASHGVGE